MHGRIEFIIPPWIPEFSPFNSFPQFSHFHYYIPVQAFWLKFIFEFQNFLFNILFSLFLYSCVDVDIDVNVDVDKDIYFQVHVDNDDDVDNDDNVDDDDVDADADVVFDIAGQKAGPNWLNFLGKIGDNI